MSDEYRAGFLYSLKVLFYAPSLAGTLSTVRAFRRLGLFVLGPIDIKLFTLKKIN